MEAFLAYIPIDRRLEMAGEITLPEHTQGSALFADISGFTRMTRLFVDNLGRQRGAEEVLAVLNRVFDGLVESVHRYRGTVISFSGDALTCWFDGDGGCRGVAAALEMQAGMAQFAEVQAPGELKVSLSIKVAIAVGPVRRFVIGDPQFGRLDVLSGATLLQMGQTERQSGNGEVLITEAGVRNLADAVEISEWRQAGSGPKAGVIAALRREETVEGWPSLASDRLTEDALANWVLPQVADRLRRGLGHYLAELRPVTAVFVRFGGLDYDRDPGAPEKLDRYIRWVQSQVRQFEGVFLQLTIGDKGAYYYIAFGAPVTHADDSSRAVTCALVLREQPEALDFIGAVQIGIAQGQMYAGAYGGTSRRTYGILGEKVNLAAALMGVAPPGEIYCDSAVYASVRTRWHFEVAEEGAYFSKPKGPLGAVYRLAAGEDVRKDPSPAGQKMVARRREWKRLVGALENSLRGHVELLLLDGEAGIGKSTLAANIIERAVEEGFEVLLGAGSSIEQSTPYLAWREILRQFFGLSEQGQNDRLDIVLSRALQLVPEQADRFPLLNDILNLGFPENEVSAQLSPALRHENLARLVPSLVFSRAENQPILLVFEDVHWMDRLSREMSLRAAELLKAKGKNICILWITRPLAKRAGAEEFFRELQQLGGMVFLRLDRLEDGEIGQLVAWELQANPAEIDGQIVSQVIQRAEGNPLYARELLFTLQQRGLIVRGDRLGWELSPRFAEGKEAVPDTIQGLVLDRIDRLQPGPQTILKVAAVIGQTFMTDAISSIMAGRSLLSGKRLEKGIRTLAGQGFIERLEGGRSFQFNHAITRDVAYNTLLFAQRRELHADVGGWYEAHYDLEGLADFYPLLVYHYRQAELPERELVYLGKAADQSQARFANQEALDFLLRALSLSSDDGSRFAFLMQTEAIYELIGERENQAAALERARELIGSGGSPDQQARLALRMSLFERLTGDYGQALAHARKAIEWGRKAGDPLLVSLGEQQVGQIHVHQGQYDAALEKYELAVSGFDAREHPVQRVEVLGDIGLALVYKGDFSNAIPFFERAIEIGEVLDLKIEVLKSSANLANVYASLGDHPRAAKYYLDVLEICRQVGDPRRESIALGNLGVIYRLTWKLDRALENLEQALRIARQVRDVRKEATWLGNIGEVRLMLGQIDESLPYFEQALAISRNIGNRNGECIWGSQIGLAKRLRGDLSGAREALEQGLEISRSISNRNEEANLLYNLGLVFSDQGVWQQAQDALNAAIDLRSQLAQPHLEVESRAALAVVNQAAGNIGEARQHLEAVLKYLEKTPGLGGSEHPLRILLSCYLVLVQAGDRRKTRVLQAAHETLEKICAQITDPRLRDAFLTRAPEARQIVEEMALLES